MKVNGKIQMEKYAKDFAKLYQTYKIKEKDYDELKEIYKLVFEYSPNGIVLIDNKCKILEYNKSFAEIIGRVDLENEIIYDLMPELKDTCRNDGNFNVKDLIFENRSEYVFNVNVNEIISDGKGKLKLIILEDITERRRVFEQKKQFVNLVKHEVNTPINAIVGFLGILRTLVEEENKEIKDILEYIENSSMRLSKTVSELLKISDLISEKIKIKKEEINLSDIILEIIGERRGNILEKRIKLDFIEGVKIKIKGDRELLKKSIENLIDNAIFFNKKMGQIQIKTISENSSFRIVISDQGEGFRKIDQKYLGEPFFQIEDYKIRKKQGLGLGISASKRIVELHGGRIYFVSELKKGTSVIIEFSSTIENEDDRVENIRKEYEKRIAYMEGQINKYAEDFVKVYKNKD